MAEDYTSAAQEGHTQAQKLQKEISKLRRDLEDMINVRRITADKLAHNAVTKSGEILERIETAINARLDTVNKRLDAVRDPLSGSQTMYELVLERLFQLHRENALSAAEYDALHRLARQYDDCSLTAWQYDSAGRKQLV